MAGQVVREAAFRVLELRHYDVQLMGTWHLPNPLLCDVMDGKGVLSLLHKTGWGLSVRRLWLGCWRLWEG